MITCNLKGGIGEQLFQIFTLMSYSIDNNVAFIFPYTEFVKDNDFLYKTYWKSLLNSLFKYTTGNNSFEDIEHANGLLLTRHPTFNENAYAYTDIINRDNVLFNGYFQSYKYFDKHKDNLLKVIDIEHNKLKIRAEYFHLLNTSCVASMQFINKTNRNGHFGYADIPLSFYENALEHIPTQYKILIFCEITDRERVDGIISSLKDKYTHTFQFVDGDIPDWRQLVLMSCCGINVLSNSSFSWWGAYFNTEVVDVFYPSLWFDEETHHDTTDLFPPSWKQIEI